MTTPHGPDRPMPDAPRVSYAIMLERVAKREAVDADYAEPTIAAMLREDAAALRALASLVEEAERLVQRTPDPGAAPEFDELATWVGSAEAIVRRAAAGYRPLEGCR